MCVCAQWDKIFFYPKTKDGMLEENQRSNSCRTSSAAGLIRPINITFRLHPSPWHTRFAKKLWTMADASADLHNNDDAQSVLMQLYQTVLCAIIIPIHC